MPGLRSGVLRLRAAVAGLLQDEALDDQLFPATPAAPTPVAPGDAVRLEDGHRVRLGDVHLQVYDPQRLHRVLAGVTLSPYHQRRSG